MKVLCRPFTHLLLALLACSAGASEVVPPGKYVRSGNSGWLTVEQHDNKTVFSIESMGGNCHTCAMSGSVRGTMGLVEEDDSTGTENVCRIRMTPSRGERKLEIETLTNEACRQHCGVRAEVDGQYRVPPKLCTKAGQQTARDAFIRHYRSKQFPQAVAALRPVLDECSDFLDWIEVDRVRNDLSLAYFHGGGAGQCLKMLKATMAADHADEEALREALPPCDFDNYLPTARATWHNMRLCGVQPDRRK